jgi:hypothetical protein
MPLDELLDLPKQLPSLRRLLMDADLHTVNRFPAYLTTQGFPRLEAVPVPPRQAAARATAELPDPAAPRFPALPGDAAASEAADSGLGGVGGPDADVEHEEEAGEVEGYADSDADSGPFSW